MIDKELQKKVLKFIQETPTGVTTLQIALTFQEASAIELMFILNELEGESIRSEQKAKSRYFYPIQ